MGLCFGKEENNVEHMIRNALSASLASRGYDSKDCFNALKESNDNVEEALKLLHERFGEPVLCRDFIIKALESRGYSNTECTEALKESKGQLDAAVSILLTKKIGKKKESKSTRKKGIPKTLKRAVWDHWIGSEIGSTKCLCCKHQSIRQIEFHCGHIIAESRGGSLSVNNLVPICAQCNLSMGNKNFHDFVRECKF